MAVVDIDLETISEAQLRSIASKHSLQHRPDRSPAEAPILKHASGSVVTDVNGKKYLDFNSGEMCAAVGHNNPRITEAIGEATRTISNSSNGFYSVAEIVLAGKLAEITPEPLQKSVFHSSGCEAVESAMLMAKKYTGGYEIMSPHESYHGLSDAPRSVTHAGWRDKVGPFAPGAYAMFTPYCYRCPLKKTYPSCELACVDASFELFDAASTNHKAAVITELLYSAGGIIEPPPTWLKKVKDKCDERDMLLIVDESQTALAKLGTAYAFTLQEGNVIPDIVVISKHLGGGTHISAAITSEAVETRIRAAGYQINHSHDADPLACRAGVAALDLMRDEDLNGEALRIEKQWRSILLKLQDEFEFIGDVRGHGIIHGIELVKDRNTREPFFELGPKVIKKCLTNGLYLTTRRRGSVIRFVPPFSTTPQQLENAGQILHDAMSNH